SKFVSSRKTHHILWIISFFDPFESRNIVSIDILQWCIENRIVAIDGGVCDVLSASYSLCLQQGYALADGLLERLVGKGICPGKVQIEREEPFGSRRRISGGH